MGWYITLLEPANDNEINHRSNHKSQVLRWSRAQKFWSIPSALSVSDEDLRKLLLLGENAW